MNRRKIFLMGAFILITVREYLCAQAATKMYWTEWGAYSATTSRVAKANVNGTEDETVFDGMSAGSGPKGCAVDNTNGHVYVAYPAGGTIERSNLDGGGQTSILTGVHPYGIALDLTHNKIYWTDYTYDDPKIMRANLDGSGSEVLTTCSAGCVLEDIDVDPGAGYIFWAERMDQELWRANLDGSGKTKILYCATGVQNPFGVAVYGGKVYWTNSKTAAYEVMRCDYDGNNKVNIVDGLGDLRYLDIDQTTGIAYWPTGTSIQCINVDGTGLTTLISGLHYSYGISLSDETVTPYIEVKLPNGGETLMVGDSYDITWSSSGTSGTVDIDYSVNSGGAWSSVISSTADDGSYSWIVPNNPSTECLVRITDADGSPTDQSDDVFTIVSEPFINVIVPKGGESWQVDSIHDIVWYSAGTSGTVDIDYSVNNGGAWSSVISSTTDDGSYSWTIPDNPSDECLVRVTDTDGSPTDINDALFSIIPIPYIDVDSPDGGEYWAVGSSHNITWTSSGAGSFVDIEYSVNNGTDWLPVTSDSPNDGSYTWTIPDNTSSTCLVRVSEAGGGLNDESDAVFSISKITVDNPEPAAEWQELTTREITWTSVGTSGDVKIEYSTNNGTDWTDVIASTTDDGTHDWFVPGTVVPGTPSTECLVKISDLGGDAVDVCDGVFSIVPAPYITITSPNTGDYWDIGTTENITWTSYGTSGTVKIEYSSNSGADWTTVELSTPDDGTYEWTVPDVESFSCIVQITDTDGAPGGQSNMFAIGHLLKAKVKVFLEGPYQAGGSMTTTLNTEGDIPVTSPYIDSRTVNSIPAGVTDWIYIELRETPSGFPVSQRSFFLRSDGYVADDDGSTTILGIPYVDDGDYYIVAKHRNHIEVMSALAQSLDSSPPTTYDFTIDASTAYDKYYGGEAAIVETNGTTYYGMFSGDTNHDGEVTTSDYTIWFNSCRAGGSGYQVGDCNGDGEVTTTDYTIWFNNARAGASSGLP